MMMELLSLERPLEVMEPITLFSSVPFGKGYSGGHWAREGVSGRGEGLLVGKDDRFKVILGNPRQISKTALVNLSLE